MEDDDDSELVEADTEAAEVVEDGEDHRECTFQNLSTASHTAA
jgi:hypothetical protein